MDYKKDYKYLYYKYKNKYLTLKNLIGSGWSEQSKTAYMKLLENAIKLSDSITCLHSIVLNNRKFFRLIDKTFEEDWPVKSLEICSNLYELASSEVSKAPDFDKIVGLTGKAEEHIKKISNPGYDYVPDVLKLRTKLIELIRIRLAKPCDKKSCKEKCDPLKIPMAFPPEDAPDAPPAGSAPGLVKVAAPATSIASSTDRVLAFDFDQTFIKEHSGGIPVDQNDKCTIKEIDGAAYNKELDRLKSLYAHIFINSRGLKQSIKRYFQACFLRGVSITDIYAATDQAEIGKGLEYWAERKSVFLNEIAQKYTKGDKSKVYFYDDTKENVAVAIKNGFTNSFVVSSPSGIDLLKSIK